MSLAAQVSPLLRIMAFEVVASTIDGRPVFSLADVVDPLPRKNGNCLRRARKLVGGRGHVLVGRAGLGWDDFSASARKIEGIY